MKTEVTIIFVSIATLLNSVSLFCICMSLLSKKRDNNSHNCSDSGNYRRNSTDD